MLDVLNAADGAALRRWGVLSVEQLAAHCEEINDLNVFPVADADTGTNLLVTMRAAVQAADRIGDGGAHDVAAAMAKGATLGARGNSGIILSQVMRGIAESTVAGPVTAGSLCEALITAARLVRGAVSNPVEGTIVTVLDAAAHGATGETIEAVARAAADAAAAALEKTPSQLAVLHDAGVVDAGGLGLVVLLDTLVEVIAGERPQRPRFERALPVDITVDATPEVHEPHRAADGQDYEVMFLVGGTDEPRIAQLRARLDELGDSVIIVGDGAGTWSAHVHCRDAGAAVEAGLAAGRLSQVRITCFVLDERRHTAVSGDRGILVIVEGDGAHELFEAEGATVLRSDEPVTGTHVLGAIRAMPHREVLVLPNGALPAQELVAVGVAARDAKRDVLLLPSACMVQGLAALAVHDAMRIAVDDAFAMSEAAAGTRWGSLRVARERALTMAGTCEPGDGLALIGREVVLIEHDVLQAGRALLDRALGLGGELLTVLTGRAASTELVSALRAHVEHNFPHVEVMVYEGGMTSDLLQLGVE